MTYRILLAAVLGIAMSAAISKSLADDLQTIEITLNGHAFAPSEIHVPTGKPFFVVVKNEGDQTDEFEMLIPPVEKALQGGGQVKVHMRPLGPGRFPFFGESDPDNEKGAFVSE